MKKLFVLPVLLVAMAMPATTAGAVLPTDTDPIGSLQWLPDNANEAKSVPAGLNRLVVVYDFGLTSSGDPAPLAARGPFGVRFFTTSTELTMKGHSPGVTSLNDAAAEQGAPEPAVGAAASADEQVIGVAGDVRSGKCANVGTPEFSEAFSTTRSFFFPGAKEYKPLAGGGACEVVESSVPATQGGVAGFQTTVTNHVPGFWIDVAWGTQEDPLGGGAGHVAPEIWYTAAYDDDAEDGEFYQVSDSVGTSESVGSPGEYDIRLSFTAAPGGLFVECTDWASGQRGHPSGYDDEKLVVEGTEAKVTFTLMPKGDWDLVVLDPEGASTVVGDGFEETVAITKPAAGEYTMRACNWSGEPTVFGAIDID